MTRYEFPAQTQYKHNKNTAQDKHNKNTTQGQYKLNTSSETSLEENQLPGGSALESWT